MFVGKSRRIVRLVRELEQASHSRLPVLITGESGTGKELSAHHIHQSSGRRGAFVPVNCTSLTEQLADSELFGHVENAFTGASRAHAGLCEAADGGTLFLDEVEDIPLGIQGKLLRFLDSGQIRRVGDVGTISVEVKVVSASNRDLRPLVSSGKFREDLYYRLSALQVRTPCLSEHREDIPELAVHLLAREGIPIRLAPDAIAALETRDYPGNVRELRNILLQASLRVRDGLLRASDLALQPSTRLSADGEPHSLKGLQAAFRRELALMALREHGGNQTQAASALGIHRNTLRRLLEQEAD